MDIRPIPHWKDTGSQVETIQSKNVRGQRIEVDNNTTYIDKNVGNDMTLTDANTGTKTLAELLAGSGVFTEILLTPKASSTGAEGTIFYDSDNDHLWVATE